MMIKILSLGEIVARGGIHCIKKGLSQLKEEKQIDLVIANGEGATGGFGIGKNHSVYLHKLGLDLIFLGEKGFFKRDMVEFASKASFILRPVNLPSETPGRGWKIIEIKDKKIAIVSAMGLSGFNRVHPNNPFIYLPSLVKKLKEKADFIIIEFHAATSAEKKTLFHLLKGKVSIISGSHTKALTADNEIMNGTGVISDTGRCGSIQSIGGFHPDTEIKKMMTGMPIRSQETMEGLELQGSLFTLDENGICTDTQLIRYPIASPPLKDNSK